MATDLAACGLQLQSRKRLERNPAMYPCVLFALRRESRPFVRRFSRRRLKAAPCPCWLCGTSPDHILVMETGVGRQCAERALYWLTECHLAGCGFGPPPVIIAAGFAGSLCEDFRAGDVLLASAVVAVRGRTYVSLPPGRLPDGVRGPCRLATSDRLVSDPTEKRTLGERFAAAAVDMESAAVARFCEDRGIPWLCVRAVSDDVDTRVSPQLLSLLAGGRASVPRLLTSVARRPALAVELWRLARGTRLAARNLAEALVHLLARGCGAVRC